MPTPIASVRNVGKSFGRTRALDDVSVDFRAGEVHVLAGENGAGKSTLIRILAGVVRDYRGDVLLGGEVVRFTDPASAVRARVACIHQELSLVGSMSVTDNLLLGEGGPMWGMLRARPRRARARAILDQIGLGALDPERAVDTLPLALRQLVEIARAIATDARLVIMDEPTSALGHRDVRPLFARIGDLRARGKAIVFITHRLDEIEQIADRISVLRDGTLVASRPARELGRRELVTAMVGRELTEQKPSPRQPGARASGAGPLLRIDALALERPSRVEDVSFALEQGEVIGLAGARGAGASDVLLAIFGDIALRAGKIVLGGAPFVPTPRRAVERGIVLLSGDRERALVQTGSVLDNAGLSSLGRFGSAWWVDNRALRRELERLGERVALDTPSLDSPLGHLSGGNQQKVALARCLLARPRLVLLDDATRGIDIAAREDVYRLIDELAARGVGVLVTSSDTSELVALCHRVLVMSRGRVVRELEGDTLSREAIVAAAFGAEEDAA